ncbi:MAG: hypothetical protein ABSG67_05630 [Thermoguttaceae bacterium]|jgi:hypothetical protein
MAVLNSSNPGPAIVDNFPATLFDYRVLLFALPFFMLARQAGKLRLRPDRSAPWPYLIWFGLGYGLAECLALWAGEPAGPIAIKLVRAAIMAPALFALLEFGRRQVRIAGKSLSGLWIAPLFIVLILAGALQGWEGLAATCLLALGIPGSLMSGLGLWQLSGTRTGQQRLGLQAAAVSLWLAVPAIVMSAPNALMPPAIGERGAEFLASAQNLSRAVLALCALGAWTGLGIYRSKLESADGRCSPIPLGSISAAIVLSVAIVFAGMDREGLYDTGSQNIPTDAVLAVLIPQEGPQPESHANRTWEQIVADRQQRGLNFLKGAALVAVCLAGVYYCVSIGWSALRPGKQGDTSTSLYGIR